MGQWVGKRYSLSILVQGKDGRMLRILVRMDRSFWNKSHSGNNKWFVKYGTER